MTHPQRHHMFGFLLWQDQKWLVLWSIGKSNETNRSRVEMIFVCGFISLNIVKMSLFICVLSLNKQDDNENDVEMGSDRDMYGWEWK